MALDAVSDPELVGSAIVAALGLRDLSGRSARDRLVDNLSDRPLLLVLDNFEQVLDAAPLVGDLLAAGPRVRIIVTSRAPLHLVVDQVCPVALLSVPDGGDTSEPAELEEEVEMQDPRAAARAALDQATYDAALRRGAEMTVKEAVAFVIETLRAVNPVETPR